MTTFLKAMALTAAIMAVIAGHADAGGPVIEDTAEPVAQTHLSPGEKIGLAVLGLIIIGALAGGGGNDVCNNDEPSPTDGGC